MGSSPVASVGATGGTVGDLLVSGHTCWIYFSVDEEAGGVESLRSSYCRSVQRLLDVTTISVYG